MPYIPYVHLTEGQQKEIQLLRPKWPAEEFPRFQFWVKPDGKMSRRAGHHSLTHEAFSVYDAMFKARDFVRSKGDLRDYKTANFSMTHE